MAQDISADNGMAAVHIDEWLQMSPLRVCIKISVVDGDIAEFDTESIDDLIEQLVIIRDKGRLSIREIEADRAKLLKKL